MALIGEEDREYLEQHFGQELEQPVEIEFFSRGSFHTAEAAELFDPESEDAALMVGEACRTAFQLYAELTEIAPQLNLKFNDLDSPDGQQAAEAVGLDGSLLPAAVYRAEKLAGQSRFFGIPSGYEFGTLVENLIDLSKGQTTLTENTRRLVGEINQPVNIVVFVTPT